jgi:hypothetical protein
MDRGTTQEPRDRPRLLCAFQEGFFSGLNRSRAATVFGKPLGAKRFPGRGFVFHHHSRQKSRHSRDVHDPRARFSAIMIGAGPVLPHERTLMRLLTSTPRPALSRERGRLLIVQNTSLRLSALKIRRSARVRSFWPGSWTANQLSVIVHRARPPKEITLDLVACLA